MCELSGASHDADALAMSVRDAYHLRNRVVHQGFRISGAQARRTFEAVNFVLRASWLATICTPEPFDASNWIEHFSTITESLLPSLARATGRLVLYRAVEGREDPLTYPFALARHQDTFIVTIPPGISEPVAAALTVITNDSFDYTSRPYPHLSVSATAKRFLVAGLIDTEAAAITRAVYFAFAALCREREGFNVEAASDHMLMGLRGTFRQLGHTFDTEDTRFKMIAASMASYLLRGSAFAKQAFVNGLQTKHGPVLQRALDFEKILAVLDPDAPHSMCDAFRLIHGTTMWLDSVVVTCPTERATYGTRRWEFDRA
ncbi:MAG: hypothetical protein Q8P50_14495 [Bacillota bacterium]|nr:hypothetical protein [Bacillota bacterium]